jgi:hypothetical protein
MGMFARYYVEIARPVDEVDAALIRAPETWIPGLAREADDVSRRLLTEVGFGELWRVDRTVEIRFSPPIRLSSKTILPIRWASAGAAALFPTLDADIEVAPLGPRRTQLSLNARYRPPLGAVGRTIDRALLHRVAEATMKDFVGRLGAALEARVTA